MRTKTAAKRWRASAAPSGPQPTLPELPEAVLISIMQHVPIHDRLARCALVCKAWAAAAAHATTAVQEATTAQSPLVVEGPQGCKQLQAWLQQWGQQVTSMDVEYDRASEEQSDKPATLPLPASQLCRLQTLQLCNFAVDLCAQPSSISTRSTRRASASRAHTLGVAVPAGAGASAFLPQLQSLELLDCWVSKSSFDQLGQLTALTSLRLSMTKVFTGASRALQPRQFEAALDSLLQQLQGLRQLTLEGGSALRHPEVALSPLSTMQHLQSLTLDGNAFNDETLRHFPTSLTRLDLVDIEPIYPAGAEFIVSPQSMPQQLSLLQELHLGRVYVHPAWLGRLTTLRKLSLGEAPIEEADDEDDDEYSDDADIRQLLGAVGRLTQLEELDLAEAQLAELNNLQLLTALTASSHLTALRILESSADGGAPSAPLPQGALLHMLPQGKQLPRLSSLGLEVDKFGWHQVPGSQDDDAIPWCVDVPDIARMAACLPALDTLSLLHVVRDHATVAQLTQLLPRLTSLRVAGTAFDDGAAPLVALLTSLVELTWIDSSLTPLGLQRLTALTRLTSLAVFDAIDIDEPVLSKGLSCVMLVSSEQAAAAGTPDVWRQLQQCCDEDRRAREGAEQQQTDEGGTAGGSSKKRQ